MDENTVRIVILETAKFSILELENYYSEIFKSLGYETSYKAISANPQDYEGDKSIFRNEVVDLFITDLSLGKSESADYAGLALISSLKKKYPDLFIIANSNTDVTYLDTALRLPTFDFFVHKKTMNDPKTKEEIRRKIQSVFNRNVYLQVDYRKSSIDPKYTQLAKKIELENLLRIITFSDIGAPSWTCVSKAYLKKVDGGMSKSEVYRLYGSTENDVPVINVIIKISPRQDTKIEYQNYLRFVKWYLPYTWRPEVISHAYWNELGCICYSHVFNDDESYNSLSYYVRNKQFDKVKAVVEHIFNPNYKTWYHPSNIHDEKSISDHYQSKWVRSGGKTEQNFKSLVNGVGPGLSFSNGARIDIKGEKVPEPAAYLIGNPRGKFKTCICHGDLSTNNVLLSDSGEVTFIDFQDTGIGHIFDDFIVMEVSMRLNYNSNLNFFDLFDIERQLIRASLITINNSAFSKAYEISEIVTIIRKRAFDNFFPIISFSEDQVINYLYGLAVSSYSMLRRDHFAPWQRIQILALNLAATAELAALENK